MNKIKRKLNEIDTKLLVGATAFGSVLASSIPAFATDDESISSITTSLTTGCSDCKSTAVTVFAAVIVSAMALFAIKYAVTQGISFFSRIAKKN